MFSLVENDTVVFGLEPFHSIVFCEPVGESKTARFALLVPDVHARSTKNNVEVHTINTNRGIVFNTQIDMFLDTKSKIAILTEVIPT